MRRLVVLPALLTLLSTTACSRVDTPVACSTGADCASGVCTDGRCDDSDASGGEPDGVSTTDTRDDATTDVPVAEDVQIRDIPSAEPCLTTTPLVDLGVVELGQSVTADVELVNCGTMPLAVNDIELDGDPGFTIGELSSGEIGADEIITLPVTFTGDVPGVFENTITFTTPQGPTDTTRLRAEAVTPLQDGVCLEVLPEGIEFGTVEEGARLEAPVVVRNCGSFNLRFEDDFTLSNDTDWFLFPVFEGELDPGERFDAVVEFIGFAPAGEKFAVFNQLVTSDGPAERLQLTIRASGRVAP